MLPTIAPGAAIDWPALEALLAASVSAGELAATMQDAGFHAEGDCGSGGGRRGVAGTTAIM